MGALVGISLALGLPAAPAVASTNPTAVVAWGHDSFGQASVPAGLSGVTTVAAGEFHSLAVESDGTVAAWGKNAHGQASVPAGLSGVTTVGAGTWHSLALKSDGTVVAWGKNDYGQASVPAGLGGVTAVAAGDNHGLALKSDGTVAAWGLFQASVPAGLSGVTAVAAGSIHSLAVISDGSVVAWGNDSFGQASVPAGLSGVTAVAAGVWHSLALKSDGTVVAWGYNRFGQASVPAGLSGVTAVAAGGAHSLALKSDGTVVAWGNDDYRQASVPAGLSGVTAVAAGGAHSLALKSLAPAVMLSTASISFGGQWVGTSSGSRPVTVTNTGGSPLTIEGVSVSGDFTASGTCVAGTSVAPGDSCTIDVTFTPSAGGPRSGTLKIHHDAPDGPHLVELTGTGVIEADLGITMAASPDPVRPRADLTYTITVSNAGPSAALDVTVIDALPANTQFTSVSAGSAWVCTTPAVGSPGTVRCQAPTLTKASQATIQLVVTVVAPGNSTVTNTAAVVSPWTDPDTSDNSATVATSTFGRR